MVQHHRLWATFTVFTVTVLPLVVEKCSIRSHTLSMLAATPYTPNTIYNENRFWCRDGRGPCGLTSAHEHWRCKLHEQTTPYLWTAWRPQKLLLSPQIIYICPVVQETITELHCWSCDGTALHPNVMIRIQEFLKENPPKSLMDKVFWGYSPSQVGPTMFVQDSVFHL